MALYPPGQMGSTPDGPPPTATVVASIANAQSLSSAIDIGGARLMAVRMPATWTAANLTFAASESAEGAYVPVYDDAGVEVTVTAAGDRVIGLDAVAAELAALRFIKVRSGTSGTPVNQGGAREIVFILKG